MIVFISTAAVVEVRKLDHDLACMIGFLGMEGVFKELKKVEASGNDLSIKQVKRYRVGAVRK